MPIRAPHWSVRTKVGAAVLGVATVGAVSFAVGTAQSHHATVTVRSAAATAPAGSGASNRRGAAGTVASVSGADFVIAGRGQNITVDTTGSTTFTQVVAGSVGDAAVGDNVAVSGTRASDGSLAASTIRIAPANAKPPMPKSPNPNPPTGKGSTNAPFAFGKVTANNGSQLTLSTPLGAQTVTTTSSTKVWKTESASIADVKVGDLAQATGTESGSTLDASHVNLAPAGSAPFGIMGPGGVGPRGGPGVKPAGPNVGPNAAPNVKRGVAGPVKSVSGADFVISGRGSTVTVDTTGATTFTQVVAGSVGDAVVGDNVVVTGTRASNGSLAASTIRIVPSKANAPMPKSPNGTGPANAPFAFGKVTANNGSQLTLSTPSGSQTVTTTSSTKVWETKSASISDVKVGDDVQAVGTESGSAFDATQVTISPAGSMGPFGGPRVGPGGVGGPGRGFGGPGRGFGPQGGPRGGPGQSGQAPSAA